MRLLGYGAGGQGVIAGDALAFTDYVGPGGASHLIRTRAAPKPVVQGSFARSGTVEFMMFGQRLRCRERYAHSQGAGVCMLLSRRLFGRGGASRRVRNCRYAAGLTG